MDIVRANIGDAVAISELHIATERETYKRAMPSMLENVSDIRGRVHLWHQALNDKYFNVVCLLARDPSGSLAGFLSGHITEGEETARLSAVYLLQHFQRRGFGRRLFAAFAEEACSRGTRNILAVVPAKNSDARGFLAWCGGVETCHGTFAYGGSSVRMVEYNWLNLPQLVSYFRVFD